MPCSIVYKENRPIGQMLDKIWQETLMYTTFVRYWKPYKNEICIRVNVQIAGQLILQKTGNGKRKEKQLYKL